VHDIYDMPQAVGEIARVLDRPARLCAAIPHPINSAGSFPGRDPEGPFVISGSCLDRRRTGGCTTALASA
jgi:hypothetical protein